MYTVIYELFRSPDVSPEDFVRYWWETHRPIAMSIPNLREYQICPVIEAEGVEGEEVAGFVIFRFDSRADFEQAQESPEFEATAEDAAKFIRHFTRYAFEPRIALEDPGHSGGGEDQ